MAKRRPIVWPKQPPPLTPEQEAAREAFMLAWHDLLPAKYGIVERFNHGALSRLPPGRKHWRTLEIGAGIGGHLPFEDLSRQEYHVLEMRDEFCERLSQLPGIAGVHCVDVEQPTPFDAESFDRVVAIHVLEHLRDLPRAVDEVYRILADDGIFDVVLPCEGGLAYYIARHISAKPFFEKRFGMSYDPIVANEHVNTLRDVLETLEPRFVAESISRFPLGIPINSLNLAIALRMKKKSVSS